MIALQNVTKSYLTMRGRKYVFRNMSLEIPADLNIGLIGRNGAGKSTLMRLFSAVGLPKFGQIITRGRFLLAPLCFFPPPSPPPRPRKPLPASIFSATIETPAP